MLRFKIYALTGYAYPAPCIAPVMKSNVQTCIIELGTYLHVTETLI
jgi:hypothetical protein